MSTKMREYAGSRKVIDLEVFDQEMRAIIQGMKRQLM